MARKLCNLKKKRKSHEVNQIISLNIQCHNCDDFKVQICLKFKVLNFALPQIVLSIAFACATAQFRGPVTYNSNAEKDAVILKQVFDLNPVDNSYVSR